MWILNIYLRQLLLPELVFVRDRVKIRSRGRNVAPLHVNMNSSSQDPPCPFKRDWQPRTDTGVTGAANPEDCLCCILRNELCLHKVKLYATLCAHSIHVLQIWFRPMENHGRPLTALRQPSNPTSYHLQYLVKSILTVFPHLIPSPPQASLCVIGKANTEENTSLNLMGKSFQTFQ